MKQLLSIVIGLLVLALGVSSGSARTLRVFAVGNSFSQNATTYLPQLAEAGGHELILGTAQTGGCSLERHWKAAEAELANPGSKEAKIYGGKSLAEIIGKGKWDVVTIQQYSLFSSDIETYRPYAQKLHDHLRTLQPGAEIVVHQTWAYRSDANRFGQVAAEKHAAAQREMWERSRAAYRQIAGDLGARVIPVGDAFWRVDSDPKWGYKSDASYDFKNPVFPVLPDQNTSLHVGYRWSADKKLSKDANHANVAGQYLGGLVWYGCLFRESTENLAFVPAGLSPEVAAHLRKVAWQVVQEDSPAGKAENAQQKPPGQ
jgi:Domain of unknown function (DUF4886)